MTYKILRKYKNIAGDWSCSVQINDLYTVNYLFDNEPTLEVIDNLANSYEPPKEEPDYLLIEDVE